MFKEIYYTTGDFFFKVIDAKLLRGVRDCCDKINIVILICFGIIRLKF